MQLLPDSIGGREHEVPSAFVCSWTDDRLTLTGCSDELEISDLDPREPPLQVLLQFADDELAS